MVKGGGDVKPAAGERVYLLPYADKDELRSALLEEAISSQFAEVAPRLVESCKAGAAAVEKELQKNQAELQKLQSTGDISEASCSALQVAQGEAKAVFDEEVSEYKRQIAALQSELSGLTNTYSDQLSARASELKANAERQVSLSYVFDIIGYKVTARNNTGYCVGKPGALEFNFLQKGTVVAKKMEYGVSSDQDEYGFSLGCTVKPNSSRQLTSFLSRPTVSSAEDRLRIERENLKTTKTDYSEYFSFDAIRAPGLFSFYELSSKSEGNRVVWTAKPVEWSSIAKQDFNPPELARIQALEKEITTIEQKISALPSRKILDIAISKADSCVASKAKLDQQTAAEVELKEYSRKLGTCDITKKNMTDVWAALKDFESSVPMTFMIPDIAVDPYLIEERFSEYLTSKDIQTADVGIDGKYQFKDVPKKKVLLYARYEDNFTEGYWLVPIDIAKLEAKDLNNNDLVEGDINESLAFELRDPNSNSLRMSDKQAFLQNCINEGDDEAICKCSINALQANLPDELFQKLAHAVGRENIDMVDYISGLSTDELAAFADSTEDLEACAAAK